MSLNENDINNNTSVQKNSIRNSFLLLLTAIIWGTSFVAQSAGMVYIGPFTFSVVRYILGGTILIPVIIFLRKRQDYPADLKEHAVFPRESKKDFAASGNLFFMSDDFINKSIDAASRSGKKCNGFTYVYGSDKNIPQDLLAIRRNLFRPGEDEERFNGDCNAVILSKHKDVDEELFHVMNMIYDLTRNKGYRYRDIAIVTEDISVYGEHAKRLADKNGFPAFIDARKSVSENPYIEFIRSLLSIIVKGWSYDNIFRFLKTGFTGIPEDDIDILDNYCLAAGIDRKSKWKKKWDYPGRKIKKNENDEFVPYYDLTGLNLIRIKIFELLNKTEKAHSFAPF